jgi:hypothetical protein
MTTRPDDSMPAASAPAAAPSGASEPARLLGQNLLGQPVWEKDGARRLATQPPADEGQASAKRFFRPEPGAAEEAALAFWAWAGNRSRGAGHFLNGLGPLAMDAARGLGVAHTFAFGAQMSGREGSEPMASSLKAWDESRVAGALARFCETPETRFLASDPWALDEAVRLAREAAGEWRPIAFSGLSPLLPTEALFGLRFVDQTLSSDWPREWRFEPPRPLAEATNRSDTLFFAPLSVLQQAFSMESSNRSDERSSAILAAVRSAAVVALLEEGEAAEPGNGGISVFFESDAQSKQTNVFLESFDLWTPSSSFLFFPHLFNAQTQQGKGRVLRLRIWNSDIQAGDYSIDQIQIDENSLSFDCPPPQFKNAHVGVIPTPVNLVTISTALGGAQQRAASLLRSGSRRPYAPLSPDAQGQSEALAPEAIALAFERLRARLQRSGADLAQALPERFGAQMPPLKKSLTPEQRDSVLLMLRAARERAGFILADETGFGKGRSLAALMLQAAAKGQRSLFFTERRALFSDIWRDLKAVAGEETARALLPQILVLHPKGRVYDADGSLATRAPTPKAMTAWLSGENKAPLPLITLCCYSQLNRAQKSHPRLAFLRRVASQAVLCLDEAHNAAGESNTRENIEQLIALSDFCAFSSATFAKTESALSFYAKALPIPKKELKLMAEGFAGDGQKALASALAGALAETGRLARREHAFEGAADSQVVELDGAHSDVAREALGLLGEALRSLFDLMDLAQAAKSKLLGEEKESPWLKMGSLLARLCRQHLLMCKIEAAADLAARSAAEGRKCVFALESTFGTFLSAVESGSASSLGKAGDDDEDAEGASESLSAPLEREPVFGDLFELAIDSAVPPDSPFAVGDPAIALARQRAHAAARALWPFLASPLDALREALAARGLSCGEVSGRSRALLKGEDGRWRFGPSGADAREKTVWRFNHGELDCLILTRAGSTGISLHSAEEFGDTRGRDLVELEIALNPSERLQFLGRVRRRGQLVPPRYFALSSGVAFERRHLERQARKLSKLARLTSGAEASAGEIELGDELLSDAGEAAAREWLGSRPASARMLGIDLYSPSMSGEGVCERLLKRMILLPEHEQESALAFLTRAARLEASAQERAGVGLRSLGGSLLLRRELLWGASSPERGPFEPALWLCERLERPQPRALSAADALAAAQFGRAASQDPGKALAILDEAWQAFPELIAQPARTADWKWMRGALGALAPGRAMRLPDPADNRPLEAWIEAIVAPDDLEDAPFLSQWRLDLLVPELGQRLSVSLARAKQAGKLLPQERSLSPEDLSALFERESKRPGRRRLVLEGHAAYAHWWSARMQLGRWGFFEDSLGQPRGALALPDVPGGFEGYWRFPMPLLDPEQAIAQLRLSPREDLASHWRAARADCLLRVGSGVFWLAVERSQLERYDDYALYRRFGRGRWEEINGRTYLWREADLRWLRPALASLRARGAFFFAPPAQRGWHMAHFAQMFSATGDDTDAAGSASGSAGSARSGSGRGKGAAKGKKGAAGKGSARSGGRPSLT